MAIERRACYFAGDGTVEWQDDGPGSFSVQRTATGKFRVTLPSAINGENYAVMAYPRPASSGSSARQCECYGVTSTTVNVTVFTGTSPTNQSIFFEIVYDSL